MLRAPVDMDSNHFSTLASDEGLNSVQAWVVLQIHFQTYFTLNSCLFPLKYSKDCSSLTEKIKRSQERGAVTEAELMKPRVKFQHPKN